MHSYTHTHTHTPAPPQNKTKQNCKKIPIKTHRFGSLEHSLIDLIHRREIAHVGQEDADADDVFETGAGGREDGGEVADALHLLLRLEREVVWGVRAMG